MSGEPAEITRWPGWRFWIAAALIFSAALLADGPVAEWVHGHGISGAMKGASKPVQYGLRFGVRLPGNFLMCAVLTGYFWVADGGIRRAGVIALAGIFSGVNSAIKWAVGRTRPFHGVPPFALHPFHGGLRALLVAEQNLSFPSGDAMTAFAVAGAMSLVTRKHRWIWWTWAGIVAAERIAEGAHYPSDVVAGAVLGILCAVIAGRVAFGLLGDGKHERTH